MVQDIIQVFYRFCAEHGNTGFFEVGDTLEQWRGGQVAAYVQDTPAFVQQV